jgi:hypothetical protein
MVWDLSRCISQCWIFGYESEIIRSWFLIALVGNPHSIELLWIEHANVATL